MSGSWRLFVAVPLQALAGPALAAIRTRWDGGPRGVRWVEPEQLHLTLRFLGETPRERVEPLVGELGRIARPEGAAPIRLVGGGAFPDPRRARVLWLGVAADWLEPLAGAVEAGVRRLGWPAERRRFLPHLTVGRSRRESPVDVSDLIGSWQGHPWASGSVAEFALYRSELRPEGARYSVVARFPFSPLPLSTSGHGRILGEK
ncbi:MAG: RNA 2',3'-cyclic phosphodiesterase [Bacillota bacterium]|nr:RNA 2',3'-cyclic phosphodiesterase [Bacillota bacterium]